MCVLVEAISVVVPIAVLEKKYPRGAAQYERDCPNGTYCADEHLTRVGFMVPGDVGAFVERLSRLGLVFQLDGRSKAAIQGPGALNYGERGSFNFCSSSPSCRISVP
jgi:hypothetical protein